MEVVQRPLELSFGRIRKEETEAAGAWLEYYKILAKYAEHDLRYAVHQAKIKSESMPKIATLIKFMDEREEVVARPNYAEISNRAKKRAEEYNGRTPWEQEELDRDFGGDVEAWEKYWEERRKKQLEEMYEAMK